MFLKIFQFNTSDNLISKVILNKNLQNNLVMHSFTSIYPLSTVSMNFYRNLFYYYYVFLSFKVFYFFKKIINFNIILQKTQNYFQYLMTIYYFFKNCKKFFMKHAIFNFRFL